MITLAIAAAAMLPQPAGAVSPLTFSNVVVVNISGERANVGFDGISMSVPDLGSSSAMRMKAGGYDVLVTTGETRTEHINLPAGCSDLWLLLPARGPHTVLELPECPPPRAANDNASSIRLVNAAP